MSWFRSLKPDIYSILTRRHTSVDHWLGKVSLTIHTLHSSSPVQFLRQITRYALFHWQIRRCRWLIRNHSLYREPHFEITLCIICTLIYVVRITDWIGKHRRAVRNVCRHNRLKPSAGIKHKRTCGPDDWILNGTLLSISCMRDEDMTWRRKVFREIQGLQINHNARLKFQIRRWNVQKSKIGQIRRKRVYKIKW